ncbi:unnamed protein product, partial [Prorocentrum cordatum]
GAPDAVAALCGLSIGRAILDCRCDNARAIESGVARGCPRSGAAMDIAIRAAHNGAAAACAGDPGTHPQRMQLLIPLADVFGSAA